ncbi:MAG: hypothetical protein Fur005_32710 [Roseiflexaceae bacterium]
MADLLLQPQFRQLVFTNTNAILMSSETNITIWECTRGEVRGMCAGRLLGVARDGQTLLTQELPYQFRAYRSTDGQAIGLPAVQQYDLDQRCAVYGTAQRAGVRAALHVVDALGGAEPIAIPLSLSRGEWIDNWALAPGVPYLFYTVSGEAEGHDWANGQVIDLRSCERVQFGQHPFFAVSRFLSPMPLAFSAEHHLMISSHQNRFDIYQLPGGQHLKELLIGDGGGDVVAFHPQHAWLLAINIEPIQQRDREKRAVALIDTRQEQREQQEQRRLMLPLAERIVALAISPDGQYIAARLKQGMLVVWSAERSELCWAANDPS